jgi:hypothetical protein
LMNDALPASSIPAEGSDHINIPYYTKYSRRILCI